MKLNAALISLVVLTATSTIAMAQTKAPDADTNQPAAPAVPSKPATPDAPTTSTNATPGANPAPAPAPAQADPNTGTAQPATPAAPAASTNTPAVVPAVASTNTPAAAPAPAPAVVPAVATAPAAPAPTPVVATAPAAAGQPTTVAAATTGSTSGTDASTAAPHDPSAVIPLIVMDEVPLIDAIKNLARQAGINYMLDPKINYGAADANGNVHPQPTVSLRWENLTADQALNAVLANYNLVMIDDSKTHIARISIKDPAAPEPLITKIVQLKFCDASNMVENVQSVLQDKRSKVLADSRTSQLVIVATEREVIAADQLIARLDTPTKQVLIEAKLVELQKNPSTSKGIDWSSTLQAQHFTFGNNVNGTGAGWDRPYSVTQSQTQVLGLVGTNLVPIGENTTLNIGPNQLLQNPGIIASSVHGLDPRAMFLNADGVSAVLSFLNTEADAKVLSTPRAVTLDNQEATLSVVTAEPIFKTTAGTQGSPGGAEITYTNVGTVLKVTPRISANNYINLRVVPTVADIGGVVTKTVSGLTSQADFFDIRTLDTRVLIPSGNTLVMGGLVSDQSSKGNTKVPVLGDIPVLGYAFRSETKTQNKKNLIIFITPTIVQNEDFQPTETAFLKTRVPEAKGSDFSAWDSGTPQDWSKLMHSRKNHTNEDDYADFPTTK